MKRHTSKCHRPASARLPRWPGLSLEQSQAAAGETYKAVLRIGHGCEGTATDAVVAQLPAGFRGAKPMPKAGWVLAVQRAPLVQPFESQGRRITNDVVQITWRASSPQPAAPAAQVH